MKVYDTSSQPLPALLAQAQRDGASMIIGPLLKNDVEQLYNDNAGAAAAGTLNVLALNQPEHLQSRPNICYFALFPEDEARDAANHIHQQGRQPPLLLLPRGALYASSRSYQADAGPDYRLEMERLEFSDIPLLTGDNPALLSQISAQFRGDYSLVRLYAMGMDAWTLANHFSEMHQLPGFQVAGETGTLSATPDCVINRTLSWLKYERGQLIAAR